MSDDSANISDTLVKVLANIQTATCYRSNISPAPLLQTTTPPHYRKLLHLRYTSRYLE